MLVTELNRRSSLDGTVEVVINKVHEWCRNTTVVKLILSLLSEIYLEQIAVYRSYNLL